MADKRVDIDGLAAAISQYLDEFKEATTENVYEACKETSDVILADLKASSPRDTGKYARSWIATIDKAGSWARAILHDRQYRLVHLLEYGHAKVNGGRTRPQPHVEPAQSNADDLFLRLLTKRIEAGK